MTKKLLFLVAILCVLTFGYGGGCHGQMDLGTTGRQRLDHRDADV